MRGVSCAKRAAPPSERGAAMVPGQHMLTLLVAAFLLLGAIDTSAAPPRDSDRATLTGLGSLLVLVKADDAAQRKGVDVDAITNAIESRLRAAGLTVHDSMAEARAKSESDIGILVADVELTELPGASGQIVYAVDLEVKQMATLIRDPELRSLAVTWAVTSVGVGPVSAIPGTIETMTATFLDQYRSANLPES
jgi:hypothetical protein